MKSTSRVAFCYDGKAVGTGELRAPFVHEAACLIVDDDVVCEMIGQ
jgi:hypothetical protein